MLNRARLLMLLTFAALALAPSADAADVEDANIERVVVSRSAKDVITFRIEFAESVRLGDVNTVQVAIDADRKSSTGIDGLDYSLDWTSGPALLTAVNGEPSESYPESLHFVHAGKTVTFSIAASDIGAPGRFDFYTFVEQDGHKDIAPIHQFSHAWWTYPRAGVGRAGRPSRREAYEDNNDGTFAEGSWPLGLIGIAVGGLFALGAIVTVLGLSIERHQKRKRLSRPA